MPSLRSRAGRIAFAILASLWTANAVHGSDPERVPQSETRQLPTVRQTVFYLFNGKDALTVAKLSSWTGTKPIHLRAGRCEWRLADGTLLTVTTTTAVGEEIVCWVRTK
jgi:hypothetical protein